MPRSSSKQTYVGFILLGLVIIIAVTAFFFRPGTAGKAFTQEQQNQIYDAADEVYIQMNNVQFAYDNMKDDSDKLVTEETYAFIQKAMTYIRESISISKDEQDCKAFKAAMSERVSQLENYRDILRNDPINLGAYYSNHPEMASNVAPPFEVQRYEELAGRITQLANALQRLINQYQTALNNLECTHTIKCAPGK